MLSVFAGVGGAASGQSSAIEAMSRGMKQWSRTSLLKACLACVAVQFACFLASMSSSVFARDASETVQWLAEDAVVARRVTNVRSVRLVGAGALRGSEEAVMQVPVLMTYELAELRTGYEVARRETGYSADVVVEADSSLPESQLNSVVHLLRVMANHGYRFRWSGVNGESGLLHEYARAVHADSFARRIRGLGDSMRFMGLWRELSMNCRGCSWWSSMQSYLAVDTVPSVVAIDAIESQLRHTWQPRCSGLCEYEVGDYLSWERDLLRKAGEQRLSDAGLEQRSCVTKLVVSLGGFVGVRHRCRGTDSYLASVGSIEEVVAAPDRLLVAFRATFADVWRLRYVRRDLVSASSNREASFSVHGGDSEARYPELNVSVLPYERLLVVLPRNLRFALSGAPLAEDVAAVVLYLDERLRLVVELYAAGQ